MIPPNFDYAAPASLAEAVSLLQANPDAKLLAGGHSLVFVEPREGRKHQIRRHMAGLGHPVIGDARHGHGPTNRHFEEKHGLDRQLLHLERLELGQPTGGPPIQVSSPLPGDFIAVLQRLGFRNARAGEIGD